METIRLPNVHWPLLIGYALLIYAAFLAWKQSASFFGLTSTLSFILLTLIEAAPVVLFFFPENLDSTLPILFELREWPHSLLLLSGPISIILALRLRPKLTPN